MRQLYFTSLFMLITLYSWSQNLAPINLLTDDNWGFVADYEDSRLVIGGRGDFPSQISGTIDAAMILKSDDLGVNCVREDMNQSGNLFRSIFALEMLSSQTYLVSGLYSNGLQRTIWRTSDGGVNWSNVYEESEGSSPRWFNDVECFGNECMAVGSGNKIIKSSDGGMNWVSLTPSNSSEEYYEIITNDGVNWFISSEDRVVHYSLSNGFGTRYNHPLSTRHISFTEQGNLLLGADDGTVYFSDDEGYSWVSYEINTDYRILDAWSNDQGEMYAVSDNNTVYYSNSGGDHWYMQEFPFNGGYGDIHVDAATGYGFIMVGSEAFRITAGTDDWVPLPEFVDLPDTMCVDQTYLLTVSGDPEWDYNWYINEELVATGMNPTIEFDPAVLYPQITLETTHNGNTSTLSVGPVVIIPTNQLLNEPYLADTVLCGNQNATIVMPGNNSSTTYNIYSEDTLVAGPFVTFNNDETFVTPLASFTDLEVRATRENTCGSLTTSVPLSFLIDTALALEDFTVPSFVCSGDEPIIHINSQWECVYEIDQDWPTTHEALGTGYPIQVPLNPVNGDSEIWIQATSQYGCTSNYGSYVIYEDSIKAVFALEVNCVVDSQIAVTQYSWGDQFEWILPNSNIGSTTDYDPVFSYPNPGLQEVKLLAHTDNGCIDSLVNWVMVNLQIDSIADLDTCSADTFHIKAGYGAESRYRYDRVVERIVDESGNSIIAGVYKGTGANYGNGNIASNMFIEKFDADGNLVWQHAHQGVIGQDFYMTCVTGIELDPYGNVYACGVIGDGDDSFDPFGRSDLRVYPENVWDFGDQQWGFVMKIDASGEIGWFNVIPHGQYTKATDILYQNDGRILVCAPGSDYGLATNNVILKYDSAGIVLDYVKFADETPMRTACNSSSIPDGVYIGSNVSIVGCFSNMTLPYGPKFKKLENGRVALRGYMVEESTFNNGIVFGSHSLYGFGYVEAVLEPDFTWSSAEFMVQGDVFTHQAQSPARMSVPSTHNDEFSNTYISFNFFGPFEVGGQAFNVGTEGTAIAKLNTNDVLEWINMDTIFDTEESYTNSSLTNNQYITGMSMLDDHLFVTGMYFRFARFSCQNGVYGHFAGGHNRTGRFLNKYDLLGNLIWSKDLSRENQEYSIWNKGDENCGSIEFCTQWGEDDPTQPVDPTGQSKRTRVTFTSVGSNCSLSSSCNSRSIEMLGADVPICGQDSLVFNSLIEGQFDSLRWHLYQQEGPLPMYASTDYYGESTGTLTVTDLESQSGQIYFLTGYFDSGMEISSDPVEIMPAEAFQGTVSINQGFCPTVYFFPGGYLDTIDVDVHLDGEIITVIPASDNLNTDTLQYPHTIQFGYSRPCGYMISEPYDYSPTIATITSQPVDAYVDETSTFVSFSVVVTNPEDYQWEESEDEMNWENVTGPIFMVSGTTNHTVNFNGSSNILPRVGHYFRCRITDTYDCEAVSETAQLLLNTGVQNLSDELRSRVVYGDGSTSFQLLDGDSYRLQVIDPTGRILIDQPNSQEVTLGSEISTGVYFIRVLDQSNVLTTRKVVAF